MLGVEVILLRIAMRASGLVKPGLLINLEREIERERESEIERER